jgi:hypothetical protein
MHIGVNSEKWLLAWSCLIKSARLPLQGFLWNLILGSGYFKHTQVTMGPHWLHCVCPSSCLSAYVSVGPTGWIFVKCDIGIVKICWETPNLVRIGTLHEDLVVFHIVNSPICLSTIQREMFPLQQWLCECATGLCDCTFLVYGLR